MFIIMKKRHAYTISSVALLFVLYSCTCPCIKADLRFELIGFSDTEADTIIIRKFEKNNSFNLLKDTVLIDNIQFARFGDTLFMTSYTSNVLLESFYDYELFFPQSQDNFRVAEIMEEASEQNCGIFSANKVACVNQITSCKINNLVTPVNFPNKMYVRK